MRNNMCTWLLYTCINNMGIPHITTSTGACFVSHTSHTACCAASPQTQIQLRRHKSKHQVGQAHRYSHTHTPTSRHTAAVHTRGRRYGSSLMGPMKCACVYVCVCVCLCVYLSASVCIYVHICMNMCVCTVKHLKPTTSTDRPLLYIDRFIWVPNIANTYSNTPNRPPS